MNDEQKELIRAHVQHVARHFVALPTSLEKIAELAIYSAKIDVGKDEVCNYLRRKQTQDELRLRHETLLWESCNYHREWRLVSTAVQHDPDKARYLLSRRPQSANCCSYCYIDETRSAADRERLIPELDLYGKEVDNVRLHPQCKDAWQALRRVVELGSNS